RAALRPPDLESDVTAGTKAASAIITMPMTTRSSISVKAVSGDGRFTLSVRLYYARRHQNSVAARSWRGKPDMKSRGPQRGGCFFREFKDFYGNWGPKFPKCRITNAPVFISLSLQGLK